MTSVSRREIGVLCAVLVVAAIAYWPALAGEFMYDDFFFVVENDAIKLPARVAEWLATPEAASEGKRWGTIFRPIRTLSYGLDHAAWRLNPVGYHLSSLGLHLVAVVAVWALARRCSGSAGGALAGAAVFAVHPLPSEAVAWVGARADVLGAVAALGYALLALRPGGGVGRRVAECALLVVALGCKEACAGAVPAVAAGRWLFDGRQGSLRRAATWAVAPVLVVLVYALGRSWLLGHTSRYGYLVDDHVGWTWLTVLRARVWDVGRVLAPVQLSIDYTAFPYARTLAEPTVWLAAVAIAAAAWCAWRCRRVAPAVSFGIAWWVALLLPVSQLVPLNALLADRWLHLPFAGLACVVAAAVGALGARWGSPRWRWGGRVVAVAVVGALASMTFARARDYRTEVRIWDAAVRAWPESVPLRLSRGAVRAPRVRAAIEARDPDAPSQVWAMIADVSRIQEIHPGEDRASRIAQACVGLGLPYLARVVADHGLRSTPDSFVLQAMRAEALWFGGDRAGAEAAFAAVLARPDAPRAAVDRVRVAEMVYVQPPGAAKAPTGEAAAVRAVVRQRLARMRLEAGDLVGARRELVRALADWPGSELTPCYLAQLDKEAGDLAGARGRMADILARGPHVQTAYVQAAEYALEARDAAAVGAILRPAVRRWPFSRELWALLAEAARSQGQELAAANYEAREVDCGGGGENRSRRTN